MNHSSVLRAVVTSAPCVTLRVAWHRLVLVMLHADTEPVVLILATFAYGRAIVLWLWSGPFWSSYEEMPIAEILADYAPSWVWITFFVLLGTCKLTALAGLIPSSRRWCYLFGLFVWLFHLALILLIEPRDAQRVITFSLMSWLSLWVYLRDTYARR